MIATGISVAVTKMATVITAVAQTGQLPPVRASSCCLDCLPAARITDWLSCLVASWIASAGGVYICDNSGRHSQLLLFASACAPDNRWLRPTQVICQCRTIYFLRPVFRRHFPCKCIPLHAVNTAGLSTRGQGLTQLRLVEPSR